MQSPPIYALQCRLAGQRVHTPLPLLSPTSSPVDTAGIASPMATQSWQAQAPAMSAAAERATSGGRAPTGSLPPPRRGQIKEKIIKDVVDAVAYIAAGLVRAYKNDAGGGLPVADDADEK